MKKLTLTFALLLTSAAAAHAQSTTPAGTPYPPGTSPIEPRIISDPVKRDEAHIEGSRMRGYRPEVVPSSSSGRYKPQTFKAEVVVTNHAAKAIKSVEWTATLTDPNTGHVISTYDVTSKSKIEPGKTKKLSKSLHTPRERVVNASSRNPRRPSVANVKVEIKSVTYADGTTSTTP